MKSSRIVFCLGKKRIPLVRLYLSQARDDGFHFGYVEEGFPNIHLTVFKKNGKICSHIRDDAAQVKESKYPWSQHITPDLFDDHLSRITRKWTRQMDGKTRCYVMKPALAKKLKRISPAITEGDTLQIPMEFVVAKVRLDFQNKRRWIRTTLKELSSTPPYSGYVALKGGVVKTVIPAEEGKYLCFGPRQYSRLMNEQSRLLGFDMYFDYLMLKHGELVSDLAEKKLKSGVLDEALVSQGTNRR